MGAATTYKPVIIGGRASTATPSAVSADDDAVPLWLRRTGAAVVESAVRASAADGYSNTSVAFLRDDAASDSLSVIPAWYNGASWDRPRSASVGNGVAATGILAAAPYGEYLTNANQPAITTGQYTGLQTDAAGNLRTAPQRPTAADILDGRAAVTATTGTTTLITVSAGRTWVGTLCASIDGNKAAAATGNGLVDAAFLTTGTNVTPAAGTWFDVTGSIGANAATGVVGTQIANSNCTPFTTVAPAGNTTTINYVTTCTNTTACAVKVSAIGTMQ